MVTLGRLVSDVLLFGADHKGEVRIRMGSRAFFMKGAFGFGFAHPEGWGRHVQKRFFGPVIPRGLAGWSSDGRGQCSICRAAGGEGLGPDE